jgi:ApaG protein
MEPTIGKSIEVTILATYRELQPLLLRGGYPFVYRVTIINNSDRSVQLLSRSWTILDGNGHVRNVEGEGVVGEQPFIMPGKRYEYQSWVPLSTPSGQMWGFYTMLDVETQVEFPLDIPAFQLLASEILN